VLGGERKGVLPLRGRGGKGKREKKVPLFMAQKKGCLQGKERPFNPRDLLPLARCLEKVKRSFGTARGGEVPLLTRGSLLPI